MKEKKDLLAYCGIYCGDCLGYTGVIATAAETFVEVLEKYKFDRTAHHVFPHEFKDYDKVLQMLKFMIGLKCPEVCRKRDESTTSCKVRRCCRNEGFYACSECSDFETCDKLRSLHEGLHYDSCIKNLRSIKEMGPEKWVKNGKRFRYWDE